VGQLCIVRERREKANAHGPANWINLKKGIQGGGQKTAGQQFTAKSGKEEEQPRTGRRKGGRKTCRNAKKASYLEGRLGQGTGLGR